MVTGATRCSSHEGNTRMCPWPLGSTCGASAFCISRSPPSYVLGSDSCTEKDNKRFADLPATPTSCVKWCGGVCGDRRARTHEVLRACICSRLRSCCIEKSANLVPVVESLVCAVVQGKLDVLEQLRTDVGRDSVLPPVNKMRGFVNGQERTSGLACSTQNPHLHCRVSKHYAVQDTVVHPLNLWVFSVKASEL